MEFPSRADAPPEVGLSVAAVARRLGVAPATLRTWDRRYGLGPTSHSPGSHRRYGTSDLARLDVMRRLVNTGVSAGDAARAALTGDANAAGFGSVAAPSTVVAFPADAPSKQPTTDAYDGYNDHVLDLDDSAANSNAGGGHVIAMPGATPAARGLARAAMALDGPGCVEIISTSLDQRGVVWTWEELLLPVLIAVGKRWEMTGAGIEVEHVLSEAVVAAMNSVVMRMKTTVNPRPVLLACAETELHSLPLFVIAAGLAERHIGSRVLGARVPAQALRGAVNRLGPSAVLVWSYLRASGDTRQLDELPRMRPTPLVLLGGPGWHGETPPGVTPVTDLTDALTRLTAAAS